MAALKWAILLHILQSGFADRRSVVVEVEPDCTANSLLQTKHFQSLAKPSFFKESQKEPAEPNNQQTIERVKAGKDFVLIHIPKTAGSSFEDDAQKVVSPSSLQQNHEIPFLSTPIEFGHQITMVMFRGPLSHVLSQFTECKFDPWGINITNGTAFPRFPGVYGGFKEWLTHFLHIENTSLHGALPNSEDWAEAVSFHCYNPWNMQTRYLATSWGHLAPFGLLEPNVTTAWENLNRVLFVGIKEFYNESLCLLHWWRHSTMPHSCACGGSGPLQNSSHERHGVPPHTVNDLSSSLVKEMGKLVRRDVQFYALALKRFERDLRGAAAQTGVPVVCEEGFQKVWKEVEDLLKEEDISLKSVLDASSAQLVSFQDLMEQTGG